ncbi:MAG TPA: serine/threonine-protein kinase, partial [Myxococcota bacterium]|nr:serine/threonine-protein kinase [Myxococcota bacterium]
MEVLTQKPKATQTLYCPRCLRAFRTRIQFCPADGEALTYRADDPLLGTIIGERYRITRLVGRGGMGRVYQAEHVLMRKTLALKLLHGELSAEPVMVERFHREARSSAKLDHPNIVRITDFGETPEGILYLVMEYLEGTDVHRLMKGGAALESERATRIALQTLDALDEAHRRGVVHRDLKPENMMLVHYRDQQEFLKLLDFGLATMLRGGDDDELDADFDIGSDVSRRPVAPAEPAEVVVEYGDEPDEDASPSGAARGSAPLTAAEEQARRETRRRLTERGMVYGTPEYMSPEQARGEDVDHRSDLYSLGVILYQMVTGVLPYQGKTSVEVLTQHVRAKVPSVRRAVPSVPAEVAEVIERSLAKAPGERWQTARDMHAALHGAAAKQGWRIIGGDATPAPAAARAPASGAPGPGAPPAGSAGASGPTSSEIAPAAAAEVTAASDAEDAPTIFGRYVLIERLARGGMGEVFLARSGALKGLAKPCVIKRIIPELSQDAEFVARFVDEIRLAARLEHSNIAQVFDMGRVGESYYVAMEYVEGKNLREVLARAWEERVHLPVEVAAWITRALLSALSYAHRLTDDEGRPVGLVHRDVSPHNVMVSYAGDVKLVDFGLALRSAQERHTRSGMVLGKLRYLSPEQARGEAVDRRSDLYSAGVLLYELLVGQPMFPGTDFDEVAAAVRSPRPRPPSRALSGSPLPPALDHVVLKATAPDADKRYRFAEEMRDDLSQLLAEVAPRMNEETVGGFMRGLFAADLTRDLARTDRARRTRAPTVQVEPDLAKAASLLPERAASWEKSASITIRRVPGLAEETGAIPLAARGRAGAGATAAGTGAGGTRGAGAGVGAGAGAGAGAAGTALLPRWWPLAAAGVAVLAGLAAVLVLVLGVGDGGPGAATGASTTAASGPSTGDGAATAAGSGSGAPAPHTGAS